MTATQMIIRDSAYDRLATVVSFHPKYWFAPEVLTEYRNSVQLKYDIPEP